MKKQWLSIALVLCMVLSLLPFGASAAEIVDSGECGAEGDNVTWTLDSDGLLTISGNGEMKDFFWSGRSLFYENYSIKSIDIKPGVTTIGIYAFEKCPNLTNVKIPSSVTSIGAGAFSDCTSLGSVTIPDSVTNIQMDAFTGTALYNDESNWENGVLYIDSFLIKANKDALPQNYEIKEGTAIIANSAFSGCSNLTSVTIPNSVTSVGVFSFEECTSLTDVAIPNSVTSVGDAVFYHCTALKTAVIPGSVKELPGFEGTFSQEYGFFSGCTSLSSVELGEGIESIGVYAFFDCTSLTSLKIPDSVTSIKYNAFRGCTNLTDMEIGGGIEIVESGMFKYMIAHTLPRLKSLKIRNGVKSIGDGALEDYTGLTSVEIPDSVTSIGNSAFKGCTGLTSVEIPDSVTSIGNSAFKGCTGLTSVTIPDSVTSIGYSAFSGCTGLTSVTIPDSVTSIGYSAFSGCAGLTSAKIGNGVTSIGNEAFSGCTGLTSIEIPDSVTSIGNGAFSGCTGLTSVEIGDGVTSIGGAAFSGCTGLTSVKIGNGVTSIGDSAFSGCTGLTSVEIPDDVVTIGGRAFNSCKQLKTVTLPKTLDEVGENAFDGTRVTDVYYNGTQKQWDNIMIRTGNEPLNKATLHLTGEPKPAANPFKDVSKDQYYYEPVLWAVNHDPQITAGTSATTFSPANPCTRGQIVTFLWRAKGCPEPTITKNPFTDVKSSDYFYKAVLWAVEKEITAGTSKTTFSPAATVTRAQTVTFLWRAEGKPAVKTANPFKDVPAGQYYTDAVLWAVKNEITAGTSAMTFSPNNPCTRAQIVTFLYRDLAK